MNKNIMIVVDDIHLEGRPEEMHLQFAEKIIIEINNIKSQKNNPILIFAGDISEGLAGIDWIKQFDCDTIYICGNHEFWNGDYYEVIDNLKSRSKEPGYEKIRFLHNEEAIINGTRFLGATLWADLGKSWPWIKQNYILKHFMSMADFRKITAKKFYQSQENIDRMVELLLDNGISQEQIDGLISKQSYNPFLQIEENIKSVEFIEDKMIEPFDGETVVVSHHLPIPDFWMQVNKMHDQILSAPYINNKTIYQKYLKQKIEADKDILMMGFYVNTAYQFFEHSFSPDIWVHGHFHKEVDSFFGTTRIVSNPLGYLKQSSDFNLKTVEVGDKMGDYVSYSTKSITNYDWDKKITSNLKNLEATINGLVKMVGNKDEDLTDSVRPIINSFKKIHEQNLKDVEKYISSILFNLIKIINRDIDVPDHLYVTSYVSGFGRWVSKNKVPGVSLLNFVVNENSFISEAKFKKMDLSDLDEGGKNFHYSQWLNSLQEVITQTEQFKQGLIKFIYEIQKDPKLEENYINNVD